MNKKLTLQLVFTLLTLVSFGQYPNTVTLYENCVYGGRRFELEIGNYRTYQMKIGNDKLSSIKVPNGLKVTLYEHDKFQGRSVTYTSNISCLPSDWNESASSIVVESTFDNTNNSDDYIVFYADCYNKGF